MIDLFTNHLLSLILFTPVIAAALVILLPERPRLVRGFAAGAALIPLALAVLAWIRYDPSAAGFQLEERTVWYAAIGAEYHLAVDGISLPLVLLATLLTPLALIISGGVKDKLRIYCALFLLLETGMLGVFLSLDLFLFFVFWEAGLIPMYFLISQWGGERRDYAALKFLLFTMGGSLGLLLAIQAMRLAAGTFDLTALTRILPALTDGAVFGVPVATAKAVAFWALVIAFAIKVPIWPFHTWLPDAHTEAPTAGSMILAGVLLKLGGYGFLRLVLPLFPAESKTFAPALALLAAAAIVFGALSAWSQKDFKRLVAYSSVNHMGFVALGVAAAAWLGAESPAGRLALSGAVLQMVAHGLSAAGMFLLVGVLYERTHTRSLEEYGGLWRLAPVYGGILIFTAMGSLGLPGLAGFAAELLVVLGAWQAFPLLTAIGMIGLLMTGAYILKAVGSVLQGPFNERWVGHTLEIGKMEILAMVPLMALMLAIGVWPGWILTLIGSGIK